MDADATRGTAWTGRSYGGGLGTRIVTVVARLGPIPLYLFALGPALWILLRDRRARMASLEWWDRVRPGAPGRRGQLVAAGLHFWSFARTLCDRLLVYRRPAAIACRHTGAPAMLGAMRSGDGCILLSAHLGNWEMAGRWLTRYGDLPITIAMRVGEDPKVRRELERVMGDHPLRIVDLGDGIGVGLAIAAALGRGETCCLLGDRDAGSGDVEHARFLGRPAPFPRGPFLAAAATGAWVVPCFALRTGSGRYTMHADPPFRIAERPDAGRRKAVHRALRTWVGRLEAVARRHPYQWHNFYPFWIDPQMPERSHRPAR